MTSESAAGLARLLIGAVLMFGGPVLAQPSEVEGNRKVDSLEIFMAADGNDASSGLVPSQPVRTLERVRMLVERGIQSSPRTVDITIAPGTYAGQGVVWDVAGGEVPITITGSSDPSKPTVFDGSTATTNFFVVRIPKKDDKRVRTNITIRDITVRNYCEGISFGDFKTKALIAKNTIERVRFENIGTKYEAQSVERRGNCVAAVRVSRASDVTVRASMFTNIENLPQGETESGRYGPLALHAVYIADFSESVTVMDSHFARFTGSAVRFRNRSNGLTVTNSTFSEAIAVPNAPGKPAPRFAAVSQWNCTTSNKACEVKQGECPSVNIVLQGLRIDGTMELYSDETANRGDPTCEDKQLNRRYKSQAPEFAVQVK